MQVHHIAITVTNLEQSVRFYMELFDAQEVKRFVKEVGVAVWLKTENCVLELWQFAELKNDVVEQELNAVGFRHIAFAVTNVDEWFVKLQAKSIPVSKPKDGASGFRYLFLRDPDGIPIELIEVD